MGNKLEKCNIICCYKNTKEYNMDGKNNVIYINPNQIQLNKFQELNSNIDSNRIKSNIYNPNIKQKLDKSNSDNQKLTSQSTAMVSKKVSNKNLKVENLNINQIPEPNDKYFDKERIISRSALNESINQIQRIFQKNLIKKKKNLTESALQNLKGTSYNLKTNIQEYKIENPVKKGRSLSSAKKERKNNFLMSTKNEIENAKIKKKI